MSIKKLVQTGENNEGEFKVMDGLSFARALNNNADELETTTKVDLAVHNTPEALRKAMKEQSGKIGFHTPGGPDDLPTSEQTVSIQKGGVAQIYNEALEPEPEPTYELDFNQIILEDIGEDSIITQSGENLINLFESLGADEMQLIINSVVKDNERHTFKAKCSDMTIYGEVINISDEIPGVIIYTDAENVKVTITTDPEAGDQYVVAEDVNV